MANDTLYMTLELKDNLRNQIQQDTKDVEKLSAAVNELNVDLSKLSADKIQKNLTKNLNDAEKAMFKLLDAKEKIDKALSRNVSMRSNAFLGMDESELLRISSRLDEIIDKIFNVGAKANFSGNAVKDLLASLSTDLTLKSAKGGTSAFEKGLDKQVKERAKSEKEAMKDLERAEKDAATAAANNARNQDMVRDALSRIATARANLTSANSSASQQDQAHIQLLLSLLDKLSSKLNTMKGQFLGERGMLDGILGSGYKGLMRNVGTAIRNIGNVESGIIQQPVNILADKSGDLQRIQQLMSEMNTLQGRLKDLRAEQEKGIFRPKDIELIQNRYAALKAELDGLITSMQKLGEASGIYGGLGHLRGYTGPQNALSDEAWQAAKREAEVRDVATAAAERHKQKLAELNTAFERQAQAEEKERRLQEQAVAAQERSAQAAHKRAQASAESKRSLNKEAEEVVKLRLEMLKTQAVQLQGFIKNGKGIFNTEQIEQYKNALRDVIGMITTLKGVMANIGSFTGRKGSGLMGFVNGVDYSPMIGYGQQLLNTMSAVRQLSLEEEKLIQSIDKASSAFHNQNRVLGDLQQMTQNYISLWGAKDFLNKIIEIGGQLEMQRLSIGAILGDTAHANDLFERIKALAVQSPFGVVELDQYTKQLSAYGFKYNELYDMTKRLADISAGAGTDVGRLALALGHVRSEAALSGYTLRQFAMNNIPMVGELAKLLTETEGKLVSVADVRKRVKNKEIGYEEVETVIKRLTDEGGMFYNMQEVVSQSVKARFKNLKDSLDIMYGEMAESNVGDSLKSVAIILTELSRHWKELFAVLRTGIVILGSYKAAMLVNTLLLGKETAAVEAGIAAKYKADKANIQLASSYRLLTAEEMRFNGITGEALVMANALALSEKKLTIEGLARQVALGKLTKAEALQVVALADLTAAERVHAQSVIGNVFTYGRFTGVINGVTMSVKRLGVALKSLVWNPLTAIFAVAGVATEMWQRNNEEVERAQELNDSLFNRATEGIKNIKRMMEETGISFTLNGKDADFGDIDLLKSGGKFEFSPAANLSSAEMISAIDKWTLFIKEYSANPNSILNNSFTDQSGQVRNLAEQYELLGKAVGETAEAYVWLKQASDATQFAEDFSNKGWLDDGLIKNINDYAQDLKDYNDTISSSVAEHRQFWSVVLKAARAHTGFAGTLKREGIDAENLSAQIKVLIEDQERYAGAIDLAKKAADGIGHTLSEFERTPDSYIPVIGHDTTIKDNLDSMKSSYQAMLNDMDAWAIGYRQRLEDSGWILSKLSEGQKQAIALSIAETVAKANKGTEEIRKNVERLMREKMGIPIDADTVKTVTKIAGLKKSLEDLVGHEWTIDVKTASNFDDVISNIRKAYKNAKEYFENAKPLAIKMGIDVNGGLKELGVIQRTAILKEWKDKNPGKDSAMYEEFLDQWDKMAKQLNDAMGFSKETGISLTDPNKGKSNKGTKKDDALEKAKTQLEEVKKFYAEYKKYREVYGAEKGQSMVEDIFGMDHKRGNEIVNDYKGTIRAILNSIDSSTEPRKKFKLSGSQLIGDIDLDDAKRKLDYALKELQEYISKQTGKWSLYKQLLEKTGSMDYAMTAFSDMRIFDDASRELEKKLNEVMSAASKPLPANIWEMSDAAAQEYFKDLKEGYELWKKITEITSRNYTDALTKGADAMSAQLSIQEKIKKNEEEIARLRSEGANVPGNEARIKAIEKDNEKLRYEEFQQSADYLKFFGSVLTMTGDEVERVSQTIKDRLLVELSRGNISSREYIKNIKDINQQLKKSRGALGGSAGAFLQGGQKGLVEYREQEYANAVVDLEAARRKREKLEKQLMLANELGSEDFNRLQSEHVAAQMAEEEAKQRIENAEKALGISVKQYNTLAQMANVLSIITGVFDGLQNATKGLADMFEALGKDDAANFWSDLSDGIGAVSSAFKPVSNILQNAMNGNIGGVVSSAISAPVDLFTAPITAFAKLHDKQIQREIEASKQRMKEMETLSKNLETALDRALGGIYEVANTEQGKAEMQDFDKNLSRYIDNIEEAQKAREEYDAIMQNGYKEERKFGDTTIKIGVSQKDILQLKALMKLGEGFREGDDDILKRAQETQKYYDMQRASLVIQRAELQKQIAAEDDKKDSDSGAISDMKQQIKELDDQLYNFAKDMAKALYDIDVKSWASELGDALYEAWQKGEDGAEAFQKKASEIIGKVAKNILVTKVLETALKPVENLVVSMMDRTSGELDPVNFADQIGQALSVAMEQAVPTTEAVLDAVDEAMKKNGYDSLKEGGGSSASGSIKSITENTADILASYLNAVRADVSVNRATLQQILAAMQGQQQMPVIAQAQLNELRTLVTLAQDRNRFVSEIRDILHRVTPDGDSIRVK